MGRMNVVGGSNWYDKVGVGQPYVFLQTCVFDKTSAYRLAAYVTDLTDHRPQTYNIVPQARTFVRSAKKNRAVEERKAWRYCVRHA